MNAEVVISIATILVSIGGAVFASGKMVGRVCGKVETNTKDIGRNTTDIADLRKDFERSLNNGIRKDISYINARLSSMESVITHLCQADNEFKQAIASMNQVANDVAFIKGKLASKARRGSHEQD